MSAQERGRQWTIEHVIEAQGGPVTDVSVAFEHTRLQTPETWTCPLHTLEPGNRRVRTHVLVTSPDVLAAGEELTDGALVARYADPATGARYRQTWPVHVQHAGTISLSPSGPERIEPDVERSTVEDIGGGMQVEEYHGYTIRSEPGRPDGTYEIYWFNVDQRDDEVFRLEMRVSRLFARRQSTWPEIEDATELAGLLGRRWVHGLIHLDRFEKGKTHPEVRGDTWAPFLAGAGTSDDDLKRELLAALRRMYRAQQNTSVILSLDVDGVADVLGVRIERIRETLGDLELDGLIESYVATFGHGLTEGACRITSAGATKLDALEQHRTRSVQSAAVTDTAENDVLISHAALDTTGRMHAQSPIPLRMAVILTALGVEYQAVRGHLNDIGENVHPQGTVYERGTFGGADRPWNVAIVEIGAGNAGAAAEAERAIQYFNPASPCLWA